MKAARQCSVGGCLEVQPCPIHPSKGGYKSPFYNSRQWRRISRAYLRAHPRCVLCGQPAKVTDHITPRHRDAVMDWAGLDAEANLQALCRRCHGDKTARFDGGYGRPKRPFPRPRPGQGGELVTKDGVFPLTDRLVAQLGSRLAEAL